MLLAGNLITGGRYEESLDLARTTHERQVEVLGADLAKVLREQGKDADAVALEQRMGLEATEGNP